VPLPIRTIATTTAAALAAAFTANAFYQAAAERADRRRYPPPGRLVPVDGGRRLHVWCEGEGEVTVVVIPALGSGCLGWTVVRQQLAPSVRTCVYDRAGLGWSDPVPGWRRTVGDQADELHQMLRAAGITGPVVLVGSSTGGVVARLFAVRYPEQVAGIVLADSSHEDQLERFVPVFGWQMRGFRSWKRSLQPSCSPTGSSAWPAGSASSPSTPPFLQGSRRS
jgi:pimeloyl-ACP methyl ester carboxylesterase